MQVPVLYNSYFSLVQPQTVTEVLLWRATHTPEDRLFSIYNAKGAVVAGLTCHQLHQKAERLGSLLQEKGNVKPGSVVAVMFMPGECPCFSLMEARESSSLSRAALPFPHVQSILSNPFFLYRSLTTTIECCFD